MLGRAFSCHTHPHRSQSPTTERQRFAHVSFRRDKIEPKINITTSKSATQKHQQAIPDPRPGAAKQRRPAADAPCTREHEGGRPARDQPAAPDPQVGRAVHVGPAINPKRAPRRPAWPPKQARAHPRPNYTTPHFQSHRQERAATQAPAERKIFSHAGMLACGAKLGRPMGCTWPGAAPQHSPLPCDRPRPSGPERSWGSAFPIAPQPEYPQGDCFLDGNCWGDCLGDCFWGVCFRGYPWGDCFWFCCFWGDCFGDCFF